jgi:hypothetical protein
LMTFLASSLNIDWTRIQEKFEVISFQRICFLSPSVIREDFFVRGFIVPETSLQKPEAHSIISCETLWQWSKLVLLDILFKVVPMILFFSSKLLRLSPDEPLVFAAWNTDEEILLGRFIFFVFVCDQVSA